MMVPPKGTRTRLPHTPGTRPTVDGREELSEVSSETGSYTNDSDYESSSEDAEPPEPSPLPASRPQEPLQAVRYDTIKAVWFPKKSSPDADRIRAALGDFWEVVRTIRDRWKTDSAAVKQAEETKKEKELPLLRDRVRSQRQMMEIALKTAVEYGHADIIRL